MPAILAAPSLSPAADLMLVENVASHSPRHRALAPPALVTHACVAIPAAKERFEVVAALKTVDTKLFWPLASAPILMTFGPCRIEDGGAYAERLHV